MLIPVHIHLDVHSTHALNTHTHPYDDVDVDADADVDNDNDCDGDIWNLQNAPLNTYKEKYGTLPFLCARLRSRKWARRIRVFSAMLEWNRGQTVYKLIMTTFAFSSVLYCHSSMRWPK